MFNNFNFVIITLHAYTDQVVFVNMVSLAMAKYVACLLCLK